MIQAPVFCKTRDGRLKGAPPPVGSARFQPDALIVSRERPVGVVRRLSRPPLRRLSDNFLFSQQRHEKDQLLRYFFCTGLVRRNELSLLALALNFRCEWVRPSTQPGASEGQSGSLGTRLRSFSPPP